MIEPAFNQTQVQHAIDLGFAEGLRALMRQDPDIIMVGEIRDLADRRHGDPGRAHRPPGASRRCTPTTRRRRSRA